MPIYEFWCPKCEIEFEVQRPMAECDQPAHCPTCQSEAERLVSRFGTIIDFNVKAISKAFRKRRESETQSTQ